MYNVAKENRVAIFAALVIATLTLATTVFAGGVKTRVCHTTSSESNPIVELVVSESALETHLAHGDQIFNETTGSCEDEVSNPS